MILVRLQARFILNNKSNRPHFTNRDVVALMNTGSILMTNHYGWQFDKFLSSCRQDDAYYITKWQQEEFAPGSWVYLELVWIVEIVSS